WVHEGIPLKRKLASPLQIKKEPKKPESGIKQDGSPKFPPKKPLTDTKDSNVGSSRPFVKTSCLFKNNPKIPDIQRTSVKQVQEKVFTSDSFDQLGLHPHLASIFCILVQKQAIPVLLRGKDALVRSQTGSGELVVSLGLASRSDGPYALVLVPTREVSYAPFTWIVPGVLMGGEKKKSEKARLRKGINVLIATPGRLVDHINSTKCIHFRRVRWLILDEADRILDLGFEKAVAAVLNALNAGSEVRQNVLLSATLTEGVSRLASISLRDPVCIAVAGEAQGSSASEAKAHTQEAAGAPPASVEGGCFAVPGELQQNVVVVPSKLRLVTLAAFILGTFKDSKMVVFFSSCEQVEFHHTLFQKVLCGEPEADRLPSLSPLRFVRLHGEMRQEVSTPPFDVAARGLDLPQVTWIIQYNPPPSLAEYVHRIGRTARIGSHGSSLLILAPSEAEYVSFLASHKINISEMKMESLLSSLMKDDRFKGHQCGGKKFHGADAEETRRRATVLQTEFENYVHSSAEMVQWAKKALQSFIRAYATYPADLKHIFHVRSLHLGHVAKSFGLRDAPGKLSTSAVPSRGKKRKRRDLLKKSQGKHRLAEILQSEYSSGLDFLASKVKRKKRLTKPGNQN
uniref:ATP-dependent RNA helicase n=1 Tax=Varanus komodoensis TaxID=61221 RepID=A0A8D2IT83_VARKO